jgi:pimeloyl-ACP methyl ester carboxylesterase
MAILGILHIVWPRLGPERLLNNFIHRESFVDSRVADVMPISVSDWFHPREGRTDWHRVAKRLDYALRLARIGLPALILCGRHDPQFPPTCSEELAREIQGAQLVFFERPLSVHRGAGSVSVRCYQLSGGSPRDEQTGQ